MAIVFTQLSPSLLADRKEAIRYVEGKLHHHVLCLVPDSVKSLSGWIQNTAQATVFLASANKLPQPQLASEETCAKEKSLLEKNVQQQLEASMACVFKTLAKPDPQAQHEDIKEERFTYLEEAFKDIPKYTGVLVRRTNQAEYCLMTVGYIIRPHHIRKQLNSLDLVVRQPFPCSVVERVEVKDLAKSLASGLVSGVAGKVGVLIFNAIFPPGLPSYFDQVYKEIERIVNKEITQNTIDEINGQINGMKDWVAITYTNAKESGMSKKDLTNLLQPREPEIAIQLIGVLMEERYAEPGICVFMIGGGVHLGILQELALVDPNASSPNASPYAKSTGDYAKKYADFAKTTANKIYDTRISKIQPKSETYAPPNGTTFYNYYWFEDSYTGYRSQDWLNIVDKHGSNNPDANKQRDQAMGEYKKDEHNKLVQSMSDPVSTANEWLKLVDHPIPA